VATTFFRPDLIGTIMRTITLIPLAFVLAASAYAAPQADQPATALLEIQVRGVMPVYQLQPDQIAEVRGVYMLDNGKALKITNVNRKVYAQLGDRPLAEMVPVSEGRFASPDQQILMEYRPVAFADELVLTYPQDASVASSPMQTVRLALK
jgi:hypothetical protein